MTWDQYWAFYGNTMSEGRTPPETVYANNSNPNVDAISGPTPPFGFRIKAGVVEIARLLQ